jgi:hypothetical protein
VLLDIVLVQFLLRQDACNQALGLLGEQLQGLDSRPVPPCRPMPTIDHFGFGQLQPQRGESPGSLRAFSLSCSPLARATWSSARRSASPASPLRLDQRTASEFPGCKLARRPVLEAVAHEIEFVAQAHRHAAPGRVADRQNSAIRSDRSSSLGAAFADAVDFVHQVEPFAIGGNQTIEQALVLGRRQLFGVRRRAALDSAGFLLAPRLGQLLFRLRSAGRPRQEPPPAWPSRSSALPKSRLADLRLPRAGEEQQREDGEETDA